MAARITGKYSGLAPAITALTAIFSTVAVPFFGATWPRTSPGERVVAASIAFTSLGVGGTIGRPSAQWLSRNRSFTF